MIFRVSEVESYRQWRNDEESALESILSRLRGLEEPSEAMLAGTAFHKALETVSDGNHGCLVANGYTFHIECDIELERPETREYRCSKSYGPITITGQCDTLDPCTVNDYKTTSRFNPDRYLEGYQWRLYLDIFKAKRFRWQVFEISELKERTYRVFGFHTLTQYAYPDLHRDCERLALDLYDFARIHLPERQEAA